MNSLEESVERFDKNSVGHIYSWSAVKQIHKVRTGIYQKHGRLISLLTDFGVMNPCYPDFYENTSAEGLAVSENVIFYTGAGRRGDQKLDVYNKSLFNAIESCHAVPLFQKIAVGRWKYLGLWRVVAAKYIFETERERMVWKFELHRDEPPRKV